MRSYRTWPISGTQDAPERARVTLGAQFRSGVLFIYRWPRAETGGSEVSTPAHTRLVPRVLLSRREAAEALGMSLRHFQRHVQPHVRCVYSGQLRLYPLKELERWAEAQAHGREHAA
jgi:hypothetical protein